MKWEVNVSDWVTKFWAWGVGGRNLYRAANEIFLKSQKLYWETNTLSHTFIFFFLSIPSLFQKTGNFQLGLIRAVHSSKRYGLDSKISGSIRVQATDLGLIRFREDLGSSTSSDFKMPFLTIQLYYFRFFPFLNMIYKAME